MLAPGRMRGAKLHVKGDCSEKNGYLLKGSRGYDEDERCRSRHVQCDLRDGWP